MTRLPLVALLAASTTFAAPPTCKERVKALTDLAAQKEKEALAQLKGPHRVPAYQLEKLDDVLSSREGWKERGFRISAGARDAVKATAATLNTLATTASVELCLSREGPVEVRASTGASDKELQPLLKLANDAPAMDRATIIAGQMMDQPVKCKGVKEAFEATAAAEPVERLPLLLKGTAAALQPCKCTAADVERTWAIATLLADVWESKDVCTRLVAPRKDAVEFTLAGATWDGVQAAIEKAGAAGVRFK